MKTCLQMGLTNVRHAMVGSLGLEKNWKNTIKSNIVQVLFDLPIAHLVTVILPVLFLFTLVKYNYYEIRVYAILTMLSNLLVRYRCNSVVLLRLSQ